MGPDLGVGEESLFRSSKADAVEFLHSWLCPQGTTEHTETTARESLLNELRHGSMSKGG